MAKAIPVAGTARPVAAKAAKRGGGSRLWLGGLICGVLITTAPGLALRLGELLLPALLACLLDRRRGQPVATPMMLMAIAAVGAPAVSALMGGAGFADLARVLPSTTEDPLRTGLVWLAAAVGWALTELLPPLVLLTLESQCKARKLALRRHRRRLAEQWQLD